ncbi:hypothetical protein BBJ28_00000663 [Nothophytophthora sp. Chile5]|nr:hypothetical protein BBJ28_00000663 [Nothophytophthora sp. Chile5]
MDASVAQLVDAEFAKQLTNLYLRSNALTDEAAVTLARLLPASKLKVLSLAGNVIGDRGAASLAFVLDQTPALQTLDLEENQVNEVVVGLADGLEPNTNLQELNLEHNWITDVGAKQLYLKAFPSNLHRRIHLSLGNSLTSECTLLLTAIWQAHGLRKRFAKEFANVERLELSGRALRQYGAAVIVEELVATSTSTCRSIDFSRNGLGDEGAKAVARLLRSYPQLEELDVSFNDIGDEGATAMAQALAENSTLVSFTLHSVAEGSQVKPKLQEKGLRQLALAIQGHKALVKVDLRDNVSSPAVVRAYVEMLHGNRMIQKFNGSNTAVFLSRYDA